MSFSTHTDSSTEDHAHYFQSVSYSQSLMLQICICVVDTCINTSAVTSILKSGGSQKSYKGVGLCTDSTEEVKCVHALNEQGDIRT